MVGKGQYWRPCFFVICLFIFLKESPKIAVSDEMEIDAVVLEEDLVFNLAEEYQYLTLQSDFSQIDQNTLLHNVYVFAKQRYQTKTAQQTKYHHALIKNRSPQLTVDHFFSKKHDFIENRDHFAKPIETLIQKKITTILLSTELTETITEIAYVELIDSLFLTNQQLANIINTANHLDVIVLDKQSQDSIIPKIAEKTELNLKPALALTQQQEQKQIVFSDDKTAPIEAKQNLAQNAAAVIGGLVYSGADIVASATHLAVSTLGNELQRFLNKVATAHVQLNVDKDLVITNSKLELLFPICDKDNDITFLQTNIHQTDNRNQANLGAGYRFLSKEWMLGANAFLDYDFSKGHTRAGVGGEYSKDFMRVSVNHYLPISDWRSASEITDYNARAAKGWDVRTKLWLPLQPQLGVKLIYEQYYGDEVALISAKTRTKNPVAISAGIEYTPFPLLTFSLDYKQNLLSRSDKDTTFSVDVTYQLGVPWSKQIDSRTLNRVRNLMHSRYELVERNNNIVLEYQQQELIVFNMTENITDYEVSTRSLGVRHSEKHYPLTIKLSAPELEAATGGELVQDPNLNK